MDELMDERMNGRDGGVWIDGLMDEPVDGWMGALIVDM
jgi:hypothetical protein